MIASYEIRIGFIVKDRYLGIWLICQLVNLLLVTSGCTRSRLDQMVLLIATRLVLLPRDSLKSMALTMRRHLPRWLASPLFVHLSQFLLPDIGHFLDGCEEYLS
jgi:hypothetical protein